MYVSVLVLFYDLGSGNRNPGIRMDYSSCELAVWCFGSLSLEFSGWMLT